MGGFFVDIYVAYLFKIVTRWLKFRDSGKWLPVNAIVTASPITSPGVWGCPTVEIVYEYRVDGELYTGLHEEPFLLADSMGEYVARFNTRTSVFVRVKPDELEVSTVREEDQSLTEQVSA